MTGEPATGRARGTIAPLSAPWWTLVAASTATFLVMLDSTAVMMALPGLGAEFDADFSGRQAVVVTHAVPLAAFLLTGGALADRFGHRFALRSGALLFTAGAVAAGASGTLLVLVVARGVQGIGSAFLLAAASTLAAHVFPGPARGKALRLLSTSAVLGLALGPLVGGLLAEVDWRLVFLSVLTPGVMLQAIGKTQLRATRSTTSATLDWPGLTLFSACVALVVLGLLRGQALGWTSTSILVMFTGAASLLFVFLLAQRARGDKAMLEPALFGNRAFLGFSLVTFVSAAIGLVAVFLTTLHLQHTLGHDPLSTGVRLSPFTAALIGTAFATRGILAKVAPGVAVGASALLVTTGAGLLALVTPNSTWLELLPGMVLVGAGTGLGITLRHDLPVRSVDPSKADIATRINGTCFHLGLAVGVAGLGALYQYCFITSIEQEGTTAMVREASAASLSFVAIVCAAVGAIFTLIALTHIHRRDLHDPETS